MSLSSKLSITDAQFKIAGQRVLIRVDFNVPQESSGKITNNARIVAALPTIKYVLEKGAKKVILMSHLGRPDGQKNPKYTLRPVAEELQKLLQREVIFASDCVGTEVKAQIDAAQDGSVILLENLRFHAEEEGSAKVDGKKIKSSEEDVNTFRAQLTELGDVFVNDAFGTAHRAHSSVVGVNLLRAAGFLMKKELEYFAKVLEKPERKFLAILGGAKVSDKIQLIDSMLNKVDTLIICGGMAYTFKKVMLDMKIGSSMYDAEGAKQVPHLLKKAEEKGVKFVFPCDHVTADKFDKDATVGAATDESGIDDGLMALDVGPKSNELFRSTILESKTILWNGPAGVFEFPKFANGSTSLLQACLDAEKNGACVIVGGGDTATVVANAGKEKDLSHVSTGGGASLELLEGKVLPGVAALSELA